MVWRLLLRFAFVSPCFSFVRSFLLLLRGDPRCLLFFVWIFAHLTFGLGLVYLVVIFAFVLFLLLFICGSFHRVYLLVILSRFPIILIYFWFRCFHLFHPIFYVLISFSYQINFFNLFLIVDKFLLTLIMNPRFPNAFPNHSIFIWKLFDLIGIVQLLCLF